MSVALLAWPIKRMAVAALRMVADGTNPPPANAGPLVSTSSRPVEVAHFLPANPERICIHGMPLRQVSEDITAEDPSVLGQTALIEFRVRVYEPGEDVEGVDQALGDMCTAVAATLAASPLFPAGRIWLSGMSQDPQDLTPNPEPSVLAVASLVFSARAVAYG